MQQHRLLLALFLLAAPALVVAQDKRANPAPLPEWDQLTSAQREELVAPLRDHWNSSPGERTRMYQHARRWQMMPADARRRAHHGMQRWGTMSPERRQHMQALFHAMRSLDQVERKAFLAQWHAMSVQQRRQWIAAHPAPERHHGGPDRD